MSIPNFIIYKNTKDLPADWNQVAKENLFLRTEFLEILEDSKPTNMTCFYVGIFIEDVLSAVAIMQLLEVQNVETFGERDSFLKKRIRDFIFRNFASTVLFLGNNLLTGQNAFVAMQNVDRNLVFKTLVLAANELKKQVTKQNKKVHLTVFKDFETEEDINLVKKIIPNYFSFSAQPNMIFDVRKTWENEADYVSSLSKKYRDQYKRARKKCSDIEKKQLSLSDIQIHHKTIYQLYRNVAKNAPFNTFYLAENHFESLKKNLQKDFMMYGYFNNNQLIGFNTLIKNDSHLETYFLGYDSDFQKEKMLYLNMLYDMIGFGIKKKFESIIFARTALEIKSSVGAKPVKTVGFIAHRNTLIQRFMPRFFDNLEPKIPWTERHPFI